MVFADPPPAIAFAPLRGFDADDVDEAFHRNESSLEDSVPALRSASTRHGLARAAVWSVCSATAIYTTKRLMVNHGFHYPLTIAFRFFAALSVIYIFALRAGTDAAGSSSRKIPQYGIRRSGGDDFFLNSQWTKMIPAALAAAAAVPLLLEGLLHMPSLPVLVMLFPLIYAAESLVLFICCSPARSQKWLPWEAVLVFAASGVVLYNEYRLMVPGLVCGVLGILFIGLSRACFTIGHDRAGPGIATQAKLKASHGFVIMTLVFGLAFSGISGYYLETIDSIYPKSNSTLILLGLNIASFVGTAFAGTSLMAYSPISFDDPASRFSNIPLRPVESVAAFVSSIFLVLAAIYSSPVPVISWVQLAAYMISSASLIGADQIHNSVLMATDSGAQKVLKPIIDEKRKPSRLFSMIALLLLAILSSLAVSYLANSSIASVSESLPSSLDLSYKPDSRFDIVVSMYKEDPTFVKKMLDSIKLTSMLSSIEPNVIIYTKDPEADREGLKRITGANIVEKIDNLGREGGTYLYHIVEKWDSLADQTMFIQAHAHNMRELIPRINDYLVPETGMLSLGFTGVLCKCGSCGDRWGWEDKYNAIPQIFEKIYKEPCEPETPILLSYKGQFVASAKRIRGINKKIYGGLMTAILSKQGHWSHNKTIVGDNKDTPDNPYFGFTMERLWGLLMQCGTDGGVAAKCPSLLSGKGRASAPLEELAVGSNRQQLEADKASTTDFEDPGLPINEYTNTIATEPQSRLNSAARPESHGRVTLVASSGNTNSLLKHVVFILLSPATNPFANDYSTQIVMGSVSTHRDSLLFLWMLFPIAIAAPLQNITIQLPEGSSNHDTPGLVCVPTHWTDIAVFFAANYVAHAATTHSLPGERPHKVALVVLAALFFPASGAFRGVLAIMSSAKRAESELGTAARAQALCMVVRGPGWKPRIEDNYPNAILYRAASDAREENDGPRETKSDPTNRLDSNSSSHTSHQVTAVEVDVAIYNSPWHWHDRGKYQISPYGRKIHGSYKLPPGYYFASVPRNASFSHMKGDPSFNASPKTTLSCSHNLVKILVALGQAIYALFTLYNTKGNQISQYGYAAFGLTVTPYAIVSILNLVGAILCPEYSVQYIVESTIFDEAVRRCDGTNYFICGAVGRLAEETIRVESAHPQDSPKPKWLARSLGVIAGSPGASGVYHVNSESQADISTIMIPGRENLPARPQAQSGSLGVYETSLDPSDPEESPTYSSSWIILIPSSNPIKGLGVPTRADQYEISEAVEDKSSSTWTLTIPGHRTSEFDKSNIIYALRLSMACNIIPLILIGCLTGFHQGNSTSAQRGWIMAWLSFGFLGSFSAPLLLDGDPTSTPAETYRASLSHSEMVTQAVGFLVYATPAIGGFVVVGQMLREFGTCVKLS
ncbi:hypothetical protein G7Y89_g12070 [Cudoniella acicularis]|uniref:Uncharacterized protein n=1 Tax=Cudoniella acicularis TaxID=354080 RepID=A0A8H4RCI9_9HELO|nr:hypothetical protein G7Y89_g12070 [Cudoniella acicularis]